MSTQWWQISGAPTPDEWMALFTALTLVAAVIAAVVALRQLRAHFETERARSRPYVFVDFAFKSILMQVEIKNIGATAARNLVLRVDPPFESGLRDQAATLNSVFSEPETISMLAPGRRILYSFDRAPDYYEAKRPERYTGTATYNDLPEQYYRPWRKGWRRQLIQYTDAYVLDFRQWSQATAESDYDNMNWNIAKRQERRTEKIAKALGAMAEKLRRSEVPPEMVTLDVVTQSELVSDAEIEHPVDLPTREPAPADFERPDRLDTADTANSEEARPRPRRAKRGASKATRPRKP